MRLRVVVGGLLLAGVALMIFWPWFVGSPPPAQADKRALADYGLRAAAYVLAIALTFMLAALGAARIMKQVRDEYVRDAQENLRGLIEGTLRDHDER